MGSHVFGHRYHCGASRVHGSRGRFVRDRQGARSRVRRALRDLSSSRSGRSQAHRGVTASTRRNRALRPSRPQGFFLPWIPRGKKITRRENAALERVSGKARTALPKKKVPRQRHPGRGDSVVPAARDSKDLATSRLEFTHGSLPGTFPPVARCLLNRCTRFCGTLEPITPTKSHPNPDPPLRGR